VTGGVKDLQDTVAEVDAVSMLEPAGRGATGNSGTGIEIARKPAGIDRFGRERFGVAISRIPSAKLLGLGGVDQDLIETKTGADVVSVRVRLQDAGTPRRERGNETGEVPGTRTRIQHGDVTATLDQVALDVLDVMGLANHGHRVRKSPYVEPASIRQLIHVRYHVPPPVARSFCPTQR
jgi:hypothetical protein